MKFALSLLFLVSSIQINTVKAEDEKKKPISRMQKILNAEKQRRIDELNGEGADSSEKFSLGNEDEYEDSSKKDKEFKLDD